MERNVLLFGDGRSSKVWSDGVAAAVLDSFLACVVALTTENVGANPLRPLLPQCSLVGICSTAVEAPPRHSSTI